MRRCALLVIMIAAVCAAPASAEVRKGPAGDAFYTPPSPLPSGKHGALIWARKATAPATLKGAASNRLLLYRSTSASGAPTAVSAALQIPKGKAPKGGWPLVTWAHGTTGIADACAPSRENVGTSDHAVLQRWLKAGYAVVRTDYEGLGTPGEHPYLIGVSEGRSVLDAALAARAADARISKTLIVAGHSQGGHAALWAAALAPKWAPGLTLRGTVAFAPASHIGEQASLLRALSTPSGLSGLASMIIRGIDIAQPSLGVTGLLSPEATALWPQTTTACIGALSAPTSFGGLAPAQLFRADAVLDPIVAALNKNDPEDLKIKTPVLVEQGTADTTVLPVFTEQLAASYKKRNVKLTYKTYAGLDHGGIVTSAKVQKHASAFIAARLK